MLASQLFMPLRILKTARETNFIALHYAAGVIESDYLRFTIRLCGDDLALRYIVL